MPNDRSNLSSDEIEVAYRTQARELWAIFYAQCSDPERAMDAVQESFTRLQDYSSAAGSEPIRDMRKWLLRVGTNWLRDCARRKVNSVKQSEHLDSMAAGQETPESILKRRELNATVREALKSIRPDDRTVLILRYALNWSSQRMGDVLGTSPQAIDMRLSRARKRLAEQLEEMWITHE
ncbi:MAG: sigma-70 family RNA polymerase sigma factor [Planctomycetota bacterium]|nr:sigma-70 family RNA polymerase sigma factor [Planctomycetota bacterium]